MIGQSIAHFSITAKLGEGGMGAVYRATDAKLGRDVAIKVLPEGLTSDADRLARFEREARTLASLNHPAIASIHEVGEDRGIHFLVMELAEGESLADHHARGPLSVVEALPVARQVSEALESAHQQGIVHRDLKPANIQLSEDGRVKVLDFGLAKAFESEGAESAAELSHSPTLTQRATMAGMLIGTAAYMSPEQARGKPADRRSDIWAFGVVLWEMLSGKQLFAGETVSDSLAAVLRADPSWDELPPETPEPLLRLLRRCLERDPARRLQHVGDARLELEDAAGAPGGMLVFPRDPDAPARSEWQEEMDQAKEVLTAVGELAAAGEKIPVRRIGLLPFLLGAALGAVLLWLWRPGQPEPPPSEERIVHAALELAEGDTLPPPTLMPLGIGRNSVILSPKGDAVAYVGYDGQQTALRYRRLDEPDWTTLDSTVGAYDPFFSPDGQWIAYFAEDRLLKVPIRGGTPSTLADAPNPYGGSWGTDDRIVFSSSEGVLLRRVDAAGGESEIFFQSADGTLQYPQVMDDARAVLVTFWESGNSSIIAVDSRSGEASVVVEKQADARALTTGHLVLGRLGDLRAVPFDVDRLAIRGTPVQVIQGVRMETIGNHQFSLSTSGDLVYVPGGDARRSRLVWAGPDGSVEPLPFAEDIWSSFELSPDGGRALMIVQGVSELRLLDFERGTSRTLVRQGVRNAIWNREGTEVFFFNREQGGGVFAQGIETAAPPRRLPLTRAAQPYDQAPDGKILLTGGPIFTLDLETGETETLIDNPAYEWGPQLSPNSRWVAYTSDRSGRYEVYAQPYPEGGRLVTISAEGGEEPRWSPDGDRIFYRYGNRFFAADVTIGDDLEVGVPELFAEGPYLNVPGLSYDVHPDGDRLLLLQSIDEDPSEPRLILGFSELLRQQVPMD